MTPDYYFLALKAFCIASINFINEGLETRTTERGVEAAKELISQLEKAISIVDNKTISDQEKYLRLQAFSKILQTENNN